MIEKFIILTNKYISLINERMAQLNEVDRFIILLVGAKKSESIPGPLHLQKEMYLLQRMFPNLATETDYEPYFMGPHSEVVADELGELKSSGLIRNTSGSINLTSDGNAVSKILRERSNKKEIEKIEEFKELLNDMTKDELLAFTYLSDPAQDALEEESTEYKDIVRNRKQLAISMYRKGKISAQKAAEISGESFENFFSQLKSVL